MSRSRNLKKIPKQLSRSRRARSLLGNNYWRLAAGVSGFAITSFLLLSVLGGRRGVMNKARALLDWETGEDLLGSDDGSISPRKRGGNEAHTH